MPSMRAVGHELGVGELTMERAFHELRDEGWFIVQHDCSARVATELPLVGSKDQPLEQAQMVLAEVVRLMRASEAMSAT